MRRMRDDPVRDQIRFLRDCLDGEEALAVVAGDGWPEPTGEVVSALRAGGFTDEQIRLILPGGPVARLYTPICCSAFLISWQRSAPSDGRLTKRPYGAAFTRCCICTETRQAGSRNGGRTSHMRA
jgi:hypothetical protein